MAGNETTRNAISHGMNAFLEHPEQWELYKAERPESAVEEIIRWATPVNVFQRTALDDTGWRPADQGGPAGRRCSTAPPTSTRRCSRTRRFDILRSPNPHLGFGGSGAHFCLGANLARLEIELIFNAIADRARHPQAAEPRRLRSGWLNGIKDLQVSYS